MILQKKVHIHYLNNKFHTSIITQSKMKTILLISIITLSLIVSANSFHLNDFDYSVAQSKQFQSYCVIMHCSKDLLINWNCKLCPNLTLLEQITYLQDQVTNVVTLVGYHRPLNSIIVMFRGTEDVKNWVQDFSFAQMLYPRCKGCFVHAGFYTSYVSVSLQLYSAIENLRKHFPTSQIVTTGSSLGAAHATIAAVQVQVLYGGVSQLHTFGSPRVGDGNFVQYLTQKVKKIRRVVHNRDIVPHVPLLTQNYIHSAHEIWFDADMANYKVCDSSGEDKNCSDSLYPNYAIQDHTTYWIRPNTTEICQ